MVQSTMSAKWSTLPFAEVIDFQEGPGILAKDFRPSGVPLIRLAGLEQGASLLTGCNFLDEEMVRKKWNHFRLSVGDVLLSTSATLGRIAEVTDEAEGAIAYTGLIRMRPRDGRVRRGFIRYLLEGPSFQRQAEAMGAGSVMKHFGPTHLKQMELSIPSPEEQAYIVSILKPIDDKIEVSRRLAATLEEMARTIFRSWFVDFDPVRAKVAAKAKGHDPEHAAIAVLSGRAETELGGLPFETLTSLTATAAQFADDFVDSALGDVPADWAIRAIGECADIVGGSTPSTAILEFWDGDIPWATPKDMSRLSAPILQETERTITSSGLRTISSGLLPRGTVLLSSRAPIGYVAMAEMQVAINQGFIAMKPNKGVPATFLLLWTQANLDEIKSRANGSTFLEISKSNFRPIPLVVPPQPLLMTFDNFASTLFAQIAALSKQIQTLAKVRDNLLPKLLAGEGV